MTIKEVRALSDKELETKLRDLKSELMNLRFQHTVNQLENPLVMQDVKKSIARVLTVMRENELKAGAQVRGG